MKGAHDIVPGVDEAAHVCQPTKSLAPVTRTAVIASMITITLVGILSAAQSC